MKVRQRKWFPVASLDNKKNFKRINRVYPDGSVVECVYLHVPDIRYREQLIFVHYIQHIVRHFIREYVGMNILGRDNPWDFEVELSSGDHFNVEITSIADHQQQFRNNSREERLARSRGLERIPLKELKKLVTFFPNENSAALVARYKAEGLTDDVLVFNPYYGGGPNIVVSTSYETRDPLDDALTEAIEKKAAKRHPGKENTVLIVDNRTGQYDLPDYFAALDRVQDKLSNWPFPEIWFYTGYYSDHDGANAEFSFAPIKATDKQEAVLATMRSQADSDGVYYSRRSDDA